MAANPGTVYSHNGVVILSQKLELSCQRQADRWSNVRRRKHHAELQRRRARKDPHA